MDYGSVAGFEVGGHRRQGHGWDAGGGCRPQRAAFTALRAPERFNETSFTPLSALSDRPPPAAAPTQKSNATLRNIHTTIGGPREILNDHFTQFLMREVQRDHWEGSKPPRVTPRSCADRTSDRGQVGRSATQRRAGENPRFRSSRNPLDSILVLDISGRVPDPGTMLGGRELLHKQILIYYIVLTRRKQLKSHLDTPHAHGWEVKYITIHAST